jgi:hypothetical protein
MYWIKEEGLSVADAIRMARAVSDPSGKVFLAIK